MSDAIVRLLIESSLRALLLAALVAVCLVALRVRASSVCHGAWTTALVGMVLMPALTRVVPAVPVAVPNVPPALVIEQTLERLARDEGVPTPMAAASQPRGLARQALPSAGAAPEWSWSWAATGVCAYTIGLLVLLARTWVGRRHAARTRAHQARLRRSSDQLPAHHDR